MVMKKLHLTAATILATQIATATYAAECLKVVAPEWSAEQQSVDPIKNISVGDTLRMSTIYDKLVEIGNDYQPKPMLAEKWDANPEATVWTFHLRKGVKFHDGRDLTARDVVYSFKRLLDPTQDSGGAAILNMLSADKITAVDDHTVEFALDKPLAILPTVLTTKYAAIVPEGSTSESLQAKPVGTGAYMVDSFTPSPKLVTQRNPNYWRETPPGAECLEMTGIAESVSRAAALSSGQADVLVMLEPQTAATIEAQGGAEIIKSPGGGLLKFAMWIDTPPFDNIKVREALKLVVDRQAFVNTVLLGMGVAGNDAPVSPLSPDAYRSDIIQRDLDKAKALLAEAGYADGLTLDLYTSDAIAVMVPAAQAFQQMAAEAGVTINLIMSPADSYWSEIFLKRPFTTDFWGDRPTAEALSIAYLTDSAYPETHFNNADYDKLIQDANASLDPAKQRELYKAAQKLLAEQGGAIIPAFVTTVAAVRKGCSGFEPNNNTAIYDFSTLKCE
jgi:peptide/nickel transport system substrate-binding protein